MILLLNVLVAVGWQQAAEPWSGLVFIMLWRCCCVCHAHLQGLLHVLALLLLCVHTSDCLASLKMLLAT